MTAAAPRLGPSGHENTFSRDRLPSFDQWPDLKTEGLDYPEQLNAAVELTDRMVAKGVRRQHRADRQRAPAYLQGTL